MFTGRNIRPCKLTLSQKTQVVNYVISSEESLILLKIYKEFIFPLSQRLLYFCSIFKSRYQRFLFQFQIHMISYQL